MCYIISDILSLYIYKILKSSTLISMTGDNLSTINMQSIFLTKKF